MSGSQRSVASRCLMMGAAALILLTALIAAPVFTRGSAAPIPFGSPAFAAQWNSIEPNVPNFWGPAYQNVFPEQYQEATGGPTSGQRLVQYFDKARMEQTTANGPVTNGLLTVELMSGNRQFGDTTFVAYPPAAIPIVGDPTNTFPTYASFGSGAFLPKSDQTTGPNGNVYNSDGTITVNSQLAADPGAAFGAYQADPGGKYAHNLPLAFSTYLAALPVPSLSVMGFPLTEAVWVRVTLNGAPTWVLVQPFERRVLSYTPTNPPGFQVEMGNIGQHYYQWRYLTNPGGLAAPGSTDTPAPGTESATMTTTTSATTSGTPSTATTARTTAHGSPPVIVSGTPRLLAISSVQLGTVTDTAFSLTFKTSLAATSEIFYGTTSHSYTSRQDISTTAAQDHGITLTDLQPSTKYFFALRATTESTSIQGRENFFTTAGATGMATIAISSSPTKIPKSFTATPTDRATNTPKPASPSATMQPLFIRVTLSHVVIGAGLSAQLAPSVMQLESATVALSVAYDGSSNALTDTARPTDWVRDPTNATASSTTRFSPLSLTDKQTTLTLTAIATIPFVDTSTPPLIVTFSRTISPSEYASGTAITSPRLNNARSPAYNVVLTFAVGLGE